VNGGENPPHLARFFCSICLREWRDGDEDALARLTTQVYSELRRLAGSVINNQSRERTVQPTALVHELYFQLPEVRHFDWQSRAHFLNVAAKVMRNILVDHARKRQTAKRGWGLVVTMSDAPARDASFDIDVLSVHEALDKFGRMGATEERGCADGKSARKYRNRTCSKRDSRIRSSKCDL
jgi:RNA polymerase sigma factor (TIGR02999 family)